MTADGSRGTGAPRRPAPGRRRGRLPNGLARAAVRFQPASFAGTFVALFMAAMIISACGHLAETGLRASMSPERYAAAPVVVTADQRAHLLTGKGEERTDNGGDSVPDKARLRTAPALRAVDSVPGAAKAVPDVTFPVRHGKQPLTAQGWGSTAFTGAGLHRGSPPRASREAVLDRDTAAALHARVGSRLTLTLPDGDRTFRVSGTAAPPRAGGRSPAVWFTDKAAQTLSGHPGRADALVVVPRSGTRPAALAGDLRDSRPLAALTSSDGGRPQVRTGDDRALAESSALPYARELLEGLGFSFGGIAAMTAVFTAAGTVALSVSQRRREFALLRAIGATPRQIRRSLATEALLVAPLAGLLGCLPGQALARWWFGELKDRDGIPASLGLHIGLAPVWAAVGTVMGTALLAGYLAARRPSKTKPGLALAESSAERFRPGVVRTLLGAGALAGGVALAGVAATEGGEDAANLALGVVLLLMVSVAFLGQYVAKACAWLLGLPLRLGPADAHLAALNSWANARRLASALTPVVLAMAFSCTLVFLQTSQDHETARQQREGLRADHVLTASGSAGPAGLSTPTAARAAEAPGVEAAVGLLRTNVLVRLNSGGSYLQTAAAQGVGGDPRRLASVQDLGIREGSLGALRPGTVAVGSSLARTARVHPGDRLVLRLPDGTEAGPRVAAVYARGAGLAEITFPRSSLADHVTSAYDSEVLVRTEAGADRAAVARALGALGHVTDKDAHQRAQDRDREINAWGNRTMAAVLAGFAAVAAANTLVMTVARRRRELRTLRLIGTTRRQVLRMVHWEAALIGVAGVVLGTAIALTALIPMVDGLFESAPYIPPGLYAAFAAAVLALALLSATVPARRALSAPVA